MATVKRSCKGKLLGEGSLFPSGRMSVLVMRRPAPDSGREHLPDRGVLNIFSYYVYDSPCLTKKIPSKELRRMKGGRVYLTPSGSDGYWEVIWRDY